MFGFFKTAGSFTKQTRRLSKQDPAIFQAIGAIFAQTAKNLQSSAMNDSASKNPLFLSNFQTAHVLIKRKKYYETEFVIKPHFKLLKIVVNLLHGGRHAVDKVEP